HKPHDGGATARARRYLRQGGPIVGHEPGLEDEVLGGVAGDGELGEGGHVGAGGFGPVEGGDDPLDVSVEVADRGVDLTQGDAKPAHRREGYRRSSLGGGVESTG